MNHPPSPSIFVAIPLLPFSSLRANSIDINYSLPAVYEQMQSPFPDESLSSVSNPMYMGPDKVVGDKLSHMGTLSRNFANPLYQEDEEDSGWSMHESRPMGICFNSLCFHPVLCCESRPMIALFPARPLPS